MRPNYLAVGSWPVVLGLVEGLEDGEEVSPPNSEETLWKIAVQPWLS
jgi:hypothetical protein